MLIFIIFLLVILIGGYFAFRYVEQVRPPRKIAGEPSLNFEFNEEIEPRMTKLHYKGEEKHELDDPQKKTTNFAQWEDDPPIYLNIKHPHVHFLLKDPDWLFSYWHWGQETYDEFNRNHGANAWENSRPVIRYQELDTGNMIDIGINDYVHTWYIKVNRRNVPVRLFLGRLLNGNFIHLATSNTLKIPLGGVSPNIDPLWRPVAGLIPESILDVGGVSSPEPLRQ
jgi:hypothetical protein